MQNGNASVRRGRGGKLVGRASRESYLATSHLARRMPLRQSVRAAGFTRAAAIPSCVELKLVTESLARQEICSIQLIARRVGDARRAHRASHQPTEHSPKKKAHLGGARRRHSIHRARSWIENCAHYANSLWMKRSEKYPLQDLCLSSLFSIVKCRNNRSTSKMARVCTPVCELCTEACQVAWTVVKLKTKGCGGYLQMYFSSPLSVSCSPARVQRWVCETNRSRCG